MLRFCLFSILALLTACSPPPPVNNGNVAGQAITIENAWIRQPPPGATVAGAYLTLSNPGTRDDRLLAVNSPSAERVEIHNMQMAAGMMQMRELGDGLLLPAGDSVSLAPGGLHLMLIAPNSPLDIGDSVTMTLTFEHAPTQAVEFAVRALMDGAQPHAHAGHHGQH